MSTEMEENETSGFRGFPSKHEETFKSKKVRQRLQNITFAVPIFPSSWHTYLVNFAVIETVNNFMTVSIDKKKSIYYKKIHKFLKKRYVRKM